MLSLYYTYRVTDTCIAEVIDTIVFSSCKLIFLSRIWLSPFWTNRSVGQLTWYKDIPACNVRTMAQNQIRVYWHLNKDSKLICWSSQRTYTPGIKKIDGEVLITRPPLFLFTPVNWPRTYLQLQFIFDKKDNLELTFK